MQRLILLLNCSVLKVLVMLLACSEVGSWIITMQRDGVAFCGSFVELCTFAPNLSEQHRLIEIPLVFSARSFSRS